MVSRTRRILGTVAGALLGLGVLIAVLTQLDLAKVWNHMVNVGWMFVPAFGAYVATLAASTMAWRYMLSPKPSHCTVPNLFVAFWAGRSINDVTPTTAPGEAVKISLLRANEGDGGPLTASLVLYNYLAAFVVFGWALSGSFAALVLLNVPLALRWAVFGAALAAVIALSSTRLLLKKGLAKNTVRLLTRMPFVHLSNPEHLEERAEDVDDRVRSFRTEQPRAFALSIVWLLLGRCAQAVELWFLLQGLFPKGGARMAACARPARAGYKLDHPVRRAARTRAGRHS